MKARVVIVAFCYDAKGQLLSTAANSYTKTHPIQAYFAEKVGHPQKIYLHAEIHALLRAKDKQVHSIRVYRYGQDGQPMLAKPCPICMEALAAYKVQNIYYSTPNGTILMKRE